MPSKKNKSWRTERQCKELLDRLGKAVDNFTEATFISAIARVAGGAITVARLSMTEWAEIQDVTDGHVTGIATPYPGGWAILLPETTTAADTTVLGHEAAHILFGDVPHWKDCEPSLQVLLTSESGHASTIDVLPIRSTLAYRSASSEEQESRAERFGALLTARVEGAAHPGPPNGSRIDEFFTVGDV